MKFLGCHADIYLEFGRLQKLMKRGNIMFRCCTKDKDFSDLQKLSQQKMRQRQWEANDRQHEAKIQKRRQKIYLANKTGLDALAQYFRFRNPKALMDPATLISFLEVTKDNNMPPKLLDYLGHAQPHETLPPPSSSLIQHMRKAALANLGLQGKSPATATGRNHLLFKHFVDHLHQTGGINTSAHS